MRGGRTVSGGVLALGACASMFLVAACSKQGEREESAPSAAATSTTTTTTTTTGSAPSAAPAAAAVAADNTDTLSGVKLASFTGDAAKGQTAFATCKTCHAVEPGVNKIGPSLHAIVGRAAGQVAGYSYTPANKNSGITWSEDKLFQYLENPQRVVPGTKMAFAGWSDPQKRADVIAYLKTQS